MPTYTYRCPQCSDGDEDPFYFEVIQTMSEYKGNSDCPECKANTDKRVYEAVPYFIGLTANQKRAGTTRRRLDMTHMMYDVRAKRKKAYGPNTREGQSNELWTGCEVKDGFVPMNPAVRKPTVHATAESG